MSKTFIRTSDIFKHDDAEIMLTRYLKCFKIASWLGVINGKKKNKDSTITLYLAGSKIRICLYYLLTMSSSDNKNILDIFRRMHYITK